MIEAITPDSYDLSLSAPYLSNGGDSPAVTAQTEAQQDDIAVRLELVPSPQIIKERHLVVLLFIARLGIVGLTIKTLLSVVEVLTSEDLMRPRSSCSAWIALESDRPPNRVGLVLRKGRAVPLARLEAGDPVLCVRVRLSPSGRGGLQVLWSVAREEGEEGPGVRFQLQSQRVEARAVDSVEFDVGGGASA